MDQAATLRNLMSERQGDPFARVAGFPRHVLLLPQQQGSQAYLMGLTFSQRLSERDGRTVLIVDAFERHRPLTRLNTTLYSVGLSRLESRMDSEIAEVIGLGRVLSVHPYLSAETDLAGISADAATMLLLQGTSEADLLQAYQQLKTLSRRAGVKKVDVLFALECDLRDTVGIHAKLEEMGNRFLGLEIGFLGNLGLKPADFLIHLKAGKVSRSLDLIASRIVSQPAQHAPHESARD